MVKRSGPRIEPWGTPKERGALDDKLLFSLHSYIHKSLIYTVAYGCSHTKDQNGKKEISYVAVHVR